jgi:hypothetical protein
MLLPKLFQVLLRIHSPDLQSASFFSTFLDVNDKEGGGHTNTFSFFPIQPLSSLYQFFSPRHPDQAS